MARQNRVTPAGEIEAVAARGLLMGNRGVLHDAAGRLGSARWRHKRWIACRLAYKGVRRPLMAPGRWTELFFLDEATALAAGHRPCAYCRREDYRRFLAAWAAAIGASARADVIDAALHAARVEPGTRRQRTWEADLAALPTGTFLRLPDRPATIWLQAGGRLRAWSHAGYLAEFRPAAGGSATVLTPRPLVAILAAGYVAALHPTAAAPAAAAG